MRECGLRKGSGERVSGLRKSVAPKLNPSSKYAEPRPHRMLSLHRLFLVKVPAIQTDDDIDRFRGRDLQ